MTTVNEDYNDKTKVADKFIFRSFFCLFVLLPNSMKKLIHNRCTCNLKPTDAYVHAREQLRLFFFVLVRYFVVLSVHL